MADDFDIYADDGLGGTGLGGDEDDFLYGDLSARPAGEVKPDLDRRESHSYSDTVDYGPDDQADEKKEQPQEVKSEANDKVKGGHPVQNGTPTQPLPGVPAGAIPAGAAPPAMAQKAWGVPPAASNASRALYVEELTWWTSDDDMRLAISEAGVVDQLVPNELSFAEHRVNGKSKGICYLPFATAEAAARAKEFFEQIEIHGRKPVVKWVPATQHGNPFRTVPKDPKEVRAEQAMKRTIPQTAGAAPTVAGVLPAAQAAVNSGGYPPAAGAGIAGRGAATAGRGRGSYPPGNYGRGAYMGGGPGFFEPEFFPPPHMMGGMGGPYPDQHGFRGGMGRGMRGGYGGGGPTRSDAYGPGFFERGPYPPGPYFDGPDYEYDGYGSSGGFGRGGGAGRGYGRPYPPGPRGPPSSTSHGRDAASELDGANGHRRVQSPSVHHDEEGEAQSTEGRSKPEPPAHSESERRKDDERGGEGSGPYPGSEDIYDKRPSVTSAHSSNYHSRDDRRPYYDDPYYERYDRRGGGGYPSRDYDRERDRYRERDRRKPGAEVYVKERATDDYERRDSHRDYDRDYDRKQRDRSWSRSRSRSHSRDKRSRSSRGRDRRSEYDQRESDPSAQLDAPISPPADAEPMAIDEREGSRSRGRSASRSKSRSPSPGDDQSQKSGSPPPDLSGDPTVTDLTSNTRDRSQSHSRSRSRSRSRHHKRKSRSHSRDGGEPDTADPSSKRRKSKHSKSSRRHHKSSRSSRSSRKERDGERDRDRERDDRRGERKERERDRERD
ncbi:uncharacterized protein SPPG_06862 [Spizellomyces punctatus DAOM BR117]|uniref:RRM domain-containing protein n=1 Tax=Spizellomyces punctatus (strain DAOM BR117) TaxID=645134 RepID=A0A0L0HAD8_SPIPD|nr:uncharacterized protein SPPG_06862 [Spizellomyces punctatus DAOM BR117]KNC97869.1 hypothetical protein SPPG_06862 [Spizellomyces punctatus DAOM BR117]|eukprot:XP_016605909.1 hypothetical protein SPPG_06862 [Spizellomyces punctatus DAOM BR117]